MEPGAVIRLQKTIVLLRGSRSHEPHPLKRFCFRTLLLTLGASVTMIALMLHAPEFFPNDKKNNVTPVSAALEVIKFKLRLMDSDHETHR